MVEDIVDSKYFFTICENMATENFEFANISSRKMSIIGDSQTFRIGNISTYTV